MNLKERIKDLCRKNGLSMNQLEQELGFGKGYISKLGKSTPNNSKMQMMANRLGVSMDYLSTGKDPTKENDRFLNGSEKKLMEYAKKLMDLGIDPDALGSLIDAVEKMQKKDK